MNPIRKALTLDEDMARASREAALFASRGQVRPLARDGMGPPGGEGGGPHEILGESPAIAGLRALVQRAAASDACVLITGESGTGKELVARALHENSSRRDRPFIKVNCAAIPKDLMESELFGYERGAFTGAVASKPGRFELASGGTLFLDEIGEIPNEMQVKLLRVLQESEITRVGATRARKIDVRIIAATNRDLMEEVAAGRFREDLFFRIAVLLLKAPPLREREGDLGPLIDGLLARVNQTSVGEPGFREKKLSPGARNLLLHHAWPGNVRELQNTLQRAAVWSEGETIGAEDINEALLPMRPPEGISEGVLDRSIEEGIDLKGIIAKVARHYLSRAMEISHGNKTKAAELVGLPNYQTLTNWLARYDVE
jgi:transcriptional regulator with PAS, ATPase and Fis domain